MMNMDLEKIIDEIANRLNRGRDISFWQNNLQLSPIVNLLSKLSAFPKASIPRADFNRVKDSIFARISAGEAVEVPSKRFFAPSASFFKIFSGVAGTLLIVISLGIGTAVAALQSVPGQAIYPLKKVVENIELSLTRDPAAKANLQIQFANTRLDELSTVLEKKEAGEISENETQKIISQTVSDLQKTTAAALDSSKSTSSAKQVSTLNKLVSLSNKQTAILKPLLSAATITNDGQVKIVLEQALETSKISKEEAIKNIENAGLKVEDQPITITTDTANKVTANGEITELTSDSITIGTSKFLVTKDTKYDNIESTELKIGLVVEIAGEVGEDKKTYAQVISKAKSDTSAGTDTETKPDTGTAE